MFPVLQRASHTDLRSCTSVSPSGCCYGASSRSQPLTRLRSRALSRASTPSASRSRRQIPQTSSSASALSLAIRRPAATWATLANRAATAASSSWLRCRRRRPHRSRSSNRRAKSWRWRPSSIFVPILRPEHTDREHLHSWRNFAALHARPISRLLNWSIVLCPFVYRSAPSLWRRALDAAYRFTPKPPIRLPRYRCRKSR